MESYAHFKVMLTALSWGNLFGMEGASVFLVLLVFTLPEPHLIYVAAFSFCSNFQPDFSKLSMDFMNFHHLTPSWHSEVGEPEQPERVFWLGLHYCLKENWEINPDHKNLMLCWTEWKWFWWISVLNELSSFQLMPWVKEVHWILCSKVLCVCKKRMPKDQRNREQREQEGQKPRLSHSRNSNVTHEKLSEIRFWDWTGRWESGKAKNCELLLCSSYPAEGNRTFMFFANKHNNMCNKSTWLWVSPICASSKV